MLPIIDRNGLFFEDLTVGQRFESGPVTVDAAEIVRFAKRFDPQIFHTDPQAACVISNGRGRSSRATA